PADVAGRPERNGTGAPHDDPAADHLPGADGPRFAGYELLGLVGRGGMGEVYRARHLRSRRVVALKTLPAAGDPGSPENRERLDRLRTEAEAVSRLQHPNIVSVYDVGEQDGRPYFTMEWLEGGTLAERLRGTPLAERLAAGHAAVLARAVQHAHERGVVHRDLK